MRANFAVLTFLAVLGVGAAAYLQGLGGAFLVDDYPNLDGLAVIPVGDFWEGVIRYATGGISSSLGRPLALLTFGVQAHSWPAHPADFIAVNIFIHLLNGCLLFAVYQRLLGLIPTRDTRAAPAIALTALFFWLLAAPQAGAVLYVVQRMALLSATFMFAGFWLYLAGRARLAEGRLRSAYVLMLAGLGVGTGLGYLAKESAALFPLLVLVIEHTLLRDMPRPRLWRPFAAVCLWLPAAAVLGGMSTFLWSYNPDDFLRTFTLGERVLTEARVLFMYLHKALLPPPYGVRLYYDDLVLSRSLLDPWTTAASVAGWIALVAAATALRRRAPMFAFAVFWFLGAHLLESTIIPLELAFDHRNYVALAGVGLAVAWYGARLLGEPRLRRVRPALTAGAIAYGAFLLVTCWQSAALWGQPWELAHFWAQRQPESRRAQQVAAKVYWHFGQPALAMASHERALERWPGDVSFFLSMVELGCAFPQTPVPDFTRIPGIVAQFDATIPAAVGTLDTLVTMSEDGRCTRYSPATLWMVTAMIFDTPRLDGQAQNRLLLQARIAELARDRARARALLAEAIDTGPPPSAFMLLRATEWSLLAGDTVCAAHYLQRFDQGRFKPGQALSYRADFARLRHQLGAATTAPVGPPHPSTCQNPAMGNAA